MGTPLQQDFKLLYREIFQAETLDVKEHYLVKDLSQEGHARAMSFLEHSLFESQHPCEEVGSDLLVALGYQSINKDTVYIAFGCADGSHRNINMHAALFLRVWNSTYRYRVQFSQKKKLGNDIWEE